MSITTVSVDVGTEKIAQLKKIKDLCYERKNTERKMFSQVRKNPVPQEVCVTTDYFSN